MRQPPIQYRNILAIIALMAGLAATVADLTFKNTWHRFSAGISKKAGVSAALIVAGK